MKKALVVLMLAVMVLVLMMFARAESEEVKETDCIFLSSLHHTTRGMAYWYDKKNGGLETLTGIPYGSSKLDCLNCHVASCDTCHKTGTGKSTAYSAKAAKNQEVCLHCHKRERAMMKIDKDSNHTDVHVSRQMQCMDCHTAREVHGDGTEYNSMKQPGVLDARCENCHVSLKKISSHVIHRDKLSCNACHVRHVVSCSNCHIETLVKEGRRVDIKLTDWVFLMNYNGQVTSATMQTFVAPGSKPFLMFAPQNSHSIMKEGRKCVDCHGTETVKQVRQGAVNLTWFENGKLQHLKGVIPVADGVTYNSVYQDYKEGKWIPIENPPKPMLHYAGYGTPLSEQQMRKLAMPLGRK